MVLSDPPALEGGAIAKCAVGMIRGLRAHGLEVSVAAAHRPFNGSMSSPVDLGVQPIEVPWSLATQAHHYLIRPFGGLARGEFKAWVNRACATADVLHLEELEAAWCDLDTHVPSAVRLHYRARLDQSLGLPWSKSFRGVLAAAIAERAAIRRHRWLVANSPEVARTLKEAAPNAEVVIAPLCLDPADYCLAPLDGPPIAGIIGTGSWAPSAAAIHRLLLRVWPKVLRRVPDARLMIAGRNTNRLRSVAGPGVEILGPVESARGFLESLSVLVYPLGRGSGMKVKVLESLAAGLPVVTTTAGAEGIQAEGGMIVDDEDDRLAAAAAQILVDVRERRERGAAARATFLRRYSPLPATEPLAELYRRMAAESV